MPSPQRGPGRDPIREFKRWYAEAARSGGPLPEAMALATATRSGIPLERIDFSVEKHMTSEPPRRIAKLVARFRIHTPCREEDFAKLVNAGKTCPVRRSLHPDVSVEETYERA